jgi:predicted unusual protein kinase regulating ubiquinone biosynthesis (AarF/ABC1/UbiB family)
MAEQDKIPTSKVQRASRFIKTSVKVGGNYVSHAVKSVAGNSTKEDLHQKNAEEVFKLLSQLKGSALKIAQMMSMDTGLLPKEYVEKFAQAQNNAMSLSGPLIVNTFQKYFNQKPSDIFDKFDNKAKHAASIGQVHEAYKNGQKLAVKIQYPGVADAIHSDIQMVKPLAARLIGVPTKFLDYYSEEFEQRLIEECDYTLELKNGLLTRQAFEQFDDIIIPNYYPEFSNHRVLTMEWIDDAVPLQQYLDTETDQEKKNALGQSLINFVFHQVHTLKKFHADPHPGNFMVTKDNKLVVLDFGCMKAIPESFYKNYFSIAKAEAQNDPKKLEQLLLNLDFIRKEDTPEERKFFYDTAKKIIDIIVEPLKRDTFYFGDKEFTEQLNIQGQELAQDKKLRQPNAIRGNRDAIFLHRTFFGMYAILYKLDATVSVDKSFLNDL